jgi:hypothetical protein
VRASEQKCGHSSTRVDLRPAGHRHAGQVIEAKGKAGGIRRARWSWKTGRFVREAELLDFCI